MPAQPLLPSQIRTQCPCRPSANQIARYVREGSLSAVEVLNWAHQRMQHDHLIRAFECVDPSAAAQAHEVGTVPYFETTP